MGPVFTPVPDRVASIVAALATLLVGCILAVGGDGLATGVTAAFLVAAPATAAAVLVSVLDPLSRIVLAMAAAVVVNALVAEAMLATGTWSIPGGVAAVGVISAVIWLATSAVSASSFAAAGAKREVTGHPANEGEEGTS
ncbi:MAG: hypothetical protein ACRDRY_17440 [Pseudonocardiaceae bacterium]